MPVDPRARIDGRMTDVTFEFRAAVEADLPAMHEVYMSVVAWIRARGETHWPIEKLSVDHLREWADLGEAYVASVDGDIVGAARVQRSDTHVWPDRDDGSALYIHKLAVTRAARGRSIGRQMLSAVEQRATNEGVGAVRLDTAMVNHRLVRYYLDAGYTHVDTVDRPPVPLGRFERQLR